MTVVEQAILVASEFASRRKTASNYVAVYYLGEAMKFVDEGELVWAAYCMGSVPTGNKALRRACCAVVNAIRTELEEHDDNAEAHP